jgi:hypothetical protein
MPRELDNLVGGSEREISSQAQNRSASVVARGRADSAIAQYPAGSRTLAQSLGSLAGLPGNRTSMSFATAVTPHSRVQLAHFALEVVPRPGRAVISAYGHERISEGYFTNGNEYR